NYILSGLSGPATIYWGPVENPTVDVLLGSGDHTVGLSRAPTGGHITFQGGGGANRPARAGEGHDWESTGTGARGGGLHLNFAGFAHLQGGSQDDLFHFADGAALTGSLDGGGGVNTLDYSAYTQAVRVNLAAGVAMNVAGGALPDTVRNIANVLGGSAADELIGHRGPNLPLR